MKVKIPPLGTFIFIFTFSANCKSFIKEEQFVSSECFVKIDLNINNLSSRNFSLDSAV